MDTETQLNSAKCGNDDAFFDLISMNKDKLYGIAYSYFHNEQDSLEAIQETTCRAYRNLHSLKKPEHLTTWLIRILINYCIDEKKRNSKLVSFDIEEVASQAGYTSQDSLSHAAAERLDLEAALSKLEPKYKKVILLKYFNDMTVSDIAQVLKCPEGTIKTWLHRAMEQLRSILSREVEFHV